VQWFLLGLGAANEHDHRGRRVRLKRLVLGDDHGPFGLRLAVLKESPAPSLCDGDRSEAGELGVELGPRPVSLLRQDGVGFRLVRDRDEIVVARREVHVLLVNDRHVRAHDLDAPRTVLTNSAF